MREFLISLTLHITLIFFISYNFREPFKKTEENSLTVNLTSTTTHSSNSENINTQKEGNQSNDSINSLEDKSYTPIKNIDISVKKKEIVVESKKNKSEITKKVSPQEKIEPLNQTNEDIQPQDNFNKKFEDSSLATSDLNSYSENFISGNLRERIAKNQNIDGLSYTILKSPNPNYPPQARKVRISEEVIIKTRFLVGLNGKVENIEILEGIENYGFRNEVTRTLRQWQFSPVLYEGENIRIYFYKDFIFHISNQ